jgi:competence protein ComGC
MRFWLDEDGVSLVETLVAMAILLAVLVPSTMFLTYIGSNWLVEDKVESYQLARNEMETIIATQNDSSLVRSEGKWVVKRSVRNQEELYYLTVDVFKSDTLKPPIITLETARIWYHN